MKTTAAIIFILSVMMTFPAILASQTEGDREPSTCTYSVRVWSTKLGRVSRTSKIEKPYKAVSSSERDPGGTGCTVCSEDQVKITLPGVAPFSACYKIADKVEATLRELLRQGEPVLSVSGYRPVMSRGALNSDGERTQLSNHAFGVAIDINRAQNGLYKNCYTWGPKCKLALGGHWRPGKTRGSLAPDGAIVKMMKARGFHWGGEINASQKDFMHFSLTGF